MNRRTALKRTTALTGIAFLPSVSTVFLSGCRTSDAEQRTPLFLNEEEMQLINAMCDTLIPETDTPGAVSLQIPEFIDLILKECLPGIGESLRKNLRDLRGRLVQHSSKDFQKCNTEERIRMLLTEENYAYETSGGDVSKSAYLMIKQLAVLGYITSESVITQLMDYHPIPVEFKGCLPMTPDTRLAVDNNF